MLEKPRLRDSLGFLEQGGMRALKLLGQDYKYSHDQSVHVGRYTYCCCQEVARATAECHSA